MENSTSKWKYKLSDENPYFWAKKPPRPVEVYYIYINIKDIIKTFIMYINS